MSDGLENSSNNVLSKLNMRWVVIVVAVILWGSSVFLREGGFLSGIFSSQLEKSLIIGKSTTEDFQKFRDNGGVSKDQFLYGFWVDSVSTNYDQKGKLSGFSLRFMKASGERVASVNAIKSEFKKYCGSKWDAYVAQTSDGITCLIRDGDLASSIEIQRLREE